MNKRIISIFLVLAAMTAMAQQKQSKIAYIAFSNIDKYITIDTATVRVWYALNALDINDENSYIDWQILEVGSHCNKYYSYFVWESDSLQTVDYRTNRSGRSSSRTQRTRQLERTGIPCTYCRGRKDSDVQPRTSAGI